MRAVLVAAAAACVLAGCGGSTTAASSSSTQNFIPKTRDPVLAAPAVPDCYAAPPEVVATIDQMFTGGEHLEHGQVVAGPGQTMYIGGNIFGADGRKVSSQDTWVEVEGLMFSLTSDARSRTAAPDGRRLAGVAEYWGDYNGAVNRCVGDIERAENLGQ